MKRKWWWIRAILQWPQNANISNENSHGENAPIIYVQIHGTMCNNRGIAWEGGEGLKKGASHNAFDRMICGRRFIKVCTFSPLGEIMIENKNDKYTLLLCLKQKKIIIIKEEKERNLSNELSILIRTRRQTTFPRKIFKRISERW